MSAGPRSSRASLWRTRTSSTSRPASSTTWVSCLPAPQQATGQWAGAGKTPVFGPLPCLPHLCQRLLSGPRGATCSGEALWGCCHGVAAVGSAGTMAAMALTGQLPTPLLSLDCSRQKENKVGLSRLCYQPDDSAPVGLQREDSRPTSRLESAQELSSVHLHPCLVQSRSLGVLARR